MDFVCCKTFLFTIVRTRVIHSRIVMMKNRNMVVFSDVLVQAFTSATGEVEISKLLVDIGHAIKHVERIIRIGFLSRLDG